MKLARGEGPARYRATYAALTDKERDELARGPDPRAGAQRDAVRRRLARPRLPDAHQRHAQDHPDPRRRQRAFIRGDLAEMLGLTIETVSRTLTALERAGTTQRTGTRGIELIGPARLAELVEAGD